MTPPTLLHRSDAATYAGVKPATLRVWAHRYGLTTHQREGETFYLLAELADVLARRVTPVTDGAIR